MKVIFVGMHNKPGMKPLDSKTMTGKVIDRIIAGIDAECIKSNLFEDDYLPTDKREIYAGNLHWNEKYQPTTDIIVLLGRWVHENFLMSAAEIIKLCHPAGIFGTKNKDQYVKDAIEKINTKLSYLKIHPKS